MDDLEFKVAAGLVTEIFKSILSGAKWGGLPLSGPGKSPGHSWEVSRPLQGGYARATWKHENPGDE